MKGIKKITTVLTVIAMMLVSAAPAFVFESAPVNAAPLSAPSIVPDQTPEYYIDENGVIHGMGYHGGEDAPIVKDSNGVEAKNRVKLNDAEEFEERYRSDKQPWAEGIIRIKDQGELGLCWAFSATTAAEYAYAKKLYEETGEIGIQEISPGHLGYFENFRVGDPLGNTDLDRNYDYGNFWPNAGSTIPVYEHLSTWSGPCTEEKAPTSNIYDHIINVSGSGLIWDGSPQPYDDSLAYDNYVTLRQSILINDYDVDEVKSLIKRYGAGVYHIRSTYLKGQNYYMPPSDSNSGANHAVVIVGWDDNYPKENFGEEIPGDGAWVIQNSWGEDSGDNGFFYASYYTHPYYIWFPDVQASDEDLYNFQYDGTATRDVAQNNTNPYCKNELCTFRDSKIANVFTNTTAGRIAVESAVLTEYNEDETDYVIDIYTDLKDPADPESGRHAASKNVSTDSSGVREFPLDKPVTVNAGSTYSVVFTFKADETLAGMECADETSLSYYTAHLDPGQSFIRRPETGKWEDAYYFDACFRVKAYARPVFDPSLFKLDEKSFVYDGQEHWPDVECYDTRGCDYEIEWPDKPVDAGTYTITVNGRDKWQGTASLTYKINKAANQLKVKGRSVTVKGTKKVKNGRVLARTKKLKVSKIVKTTRRGQGTRTYKLAGVTKAKYKKYFKVAKSSGRLTVKKGLPKGTYKVRVKVRAAGTKNYMSSGWKTVTVKVRVK